jgi:hypothetical protein
MGVDGSETRLCEYRCQVLLDDMNNWVADLPTPPKYIQAITETYRRGPGDDIYANNPVNYVKLDRLPTVDDMSPIVNAMKRGDYFWTSGEVLIPSYAVECAGKQRTVSAYVEWTFTLDFVEVVWGDGQKRTGRSSRPAICRRLASTDFRSHSMRPERNGFASLCGMWRGGALVQPIKLTGAATTTTSR